MMQLLLSHQRKKLKTTNLRRVSQKRRNLKGKRDLRRMRDLKSDERKVRQRF